MAHTCNPSFRETDSEMKLTDQPVWLNLRGPGSVRDPASNRQGEEHQKTASSASTYLCTHIFTHAHKPVHMKQGRRVRFGRIDNWRFKHKYHWFSQLNKAGYSCPGACGCPLFSCESVRLLRSWIKEGLPFFQLCSQRKDDSLGEILADNTGHVYHVLTFCQEAKASCVLQLVGY